MSKHIPRPRIDSQFMRDWLKEDAVLLDMPAEEIIHYLCEEIDQIRTHRDALLEACKAALEKCPFPVGAALVKEQLQNAIAKAEDETQGKQT